MTRVVQLTENYRPVGSRRVGLSPRRPYTNLQRIRLRCSKQAVSGESSDISCKMGEMREKNNELGYRGNYMVSSLAC